MDAKKVGLSFVAGAFLGGRGGHRGAQGAGVCNIPGGQLAEGRIPARPQCARRAPPAQPADAQRAAPAGLWLVGHRAAHQLPGRLAHGVRPVIFLGDCEFPAQRSLPLASKQARQDAGRQARGCWPPAHGAVAWHFNCVWRTGVPLQRLALRLEPDELAGKGAAQYGVERSEERSRDTSLSSRGSARSSVMSPSPSHCQCTNLQVHAQVGLVPAVRVQACSALLLRRLFWRAARCALRGHVEVARLYIGGVRTLS